MSFGTKIFTWFYGKFVGQDSYGNKYYCNSSDYSDIDAKRWVIYDGEIEASKVPAHWHAWIHKTIKQAPVNYKHKHDWQKDHKPNLTGTDEAYFPSSHPLSKKYNSESKEEDYETWIPK